MHGEDVRAVQQALTNLGYDPGPVDDIFGGKTETAVRAFQRAQGLTADGIVGPITRAALFPLHSQVSRETEQQTIPGSAGVSPPGEVESAGEGSAIPSAPHPAPDPMPGAKPSPPAPVSQEATEPPGRQTPEAESLPLPTEEMPVSEMKNKAGHTAWQASVATVVITSLEHLDGFDAAHLPDQAALTAAIATIATLASALKTWLQDRPGGGRHTS